VFHVPQGPSADYSTGRAESGPAARRLERSCNVFHSWLPVGAPPSSK
jgi:hypothetical protein